MKMLYLRGFMFDKLASSAKKNWVIIFSTVLGLALLIVSVWLVPSSDDAWKLIDDLSYTIGSVLIGSAVFGGIMKWGMLGDILQEHISKSFYDPANIKNQDVVVERWELLTKAMLSKVLPCDHDAAVYRLKEGFFNSELHYHYEDFHIRYEVNIDDATGIADISSIMTARVVKSPGSKNPVLVQRIDANGATTVDEVFSINDRNVSPLFKKEDNVYEYSIPLKSFPKSINVKRVGSRVQNVSVDPTIVWNVMRYTKGASITVKMINSNSCYKPVFTEVGLTKLPKDYEQKSSSTETTWIIADTGSLLLPGHGCTIVFTK
jgi:hypothetical protein